MLDQARRFTAVNSTFRRPRSLAWASRWARSGPRPTTEGHVRHPLGDRKENSEALGVAHQAHVGHTRPIVLAAFAGRQGQQLLRHDGAERS